MSALGERPIEQGFSCDARNAGHHGSGDLEVIIRIWDDHGRAKPLLQMSCAEADGGGSNAENYDPNSRDRLQPYACHSCPGPGEYRDPPGRLSRCVLGIEGSTSRFLLS